MVLIPLIVFVVIVLFSEGDTFSDILYGFNVKNVVKSFNEEYVIDEKNDNYYIQGKIVDRESEILQIGEFKIDLSDGNIPRTLIKVTM
jgi:hypothetical protein